MANYYRHSVNPRALWPHSKTTAVQEWDMVKGGNPDGTEGAFPQLNEATLKAIIEGVAAKLQADRQTSNETIAHVQVPITACI